MVKITRILTMKEYHSMQEEAIAKGWWRNDRRMFLPGMAWYQPWYYAPDHWPEKINWGIMEEPYCKFGDPFLSVHYWRNSAAQRPPLEVVCPNSETWEIDRKSSNGDGWTVTGVLPNITCHPSIVVHGYHGWLRDGQFSADIEGRGEFGTARETK